MCECPNLSHFSQKLHNLSPLFRGAPDRMGAATMGSGNGTDTGRVTSRTPRLVRRVMVIAPAPSLTPSSVVSHDDGDSRGLPTMRDCSVPPPHSRSVARWSCRSPAHSRPLSLSVLPSLPSLFRRSISRLSIWTSFLLTA